MRRMALQTIGLHDRFIVTGMAIETITNLRMLTMTLGTVLFTVTTWHSSELISNRLMTADTDRRQRLATGQIHLQRLVRTVAILTIPDREVRMIARCVTFKTGSWNALPLLRMTGVTFATAGSWMLLMAG